MIGVRTLAEAIPPPNPAAAPNPDAQPVLQEEAREGNTWALAKEAQNPVANLISLPIQWNATPSSQWAPRAVDPAAEANRTFNVVNVQPVIPFRLNDDWLLVSRTIVPVIQRPLAGSTDVIGIGDINPTVFLVPRSNSPVQFGLGPTLVIPSASDVQLSSQRWSAGPAAVAVLTRGPLVAGVLANNVWSFAGDGGRNVNAMLIQPFVNVNLARGWYLASSPILTADWTAPNGKGWTVPIGGGIGRIFRLGSQPFNASLQGFWNAAPKCRATTCWGPSPFACRFRRCFRRGGRAMHHMQLLSELLDACQREGPQVVSRRGTEAAVLVPPRGSGAVGRAPTAPCSPGFRALTMPNSISPA